MIAQRFRPVGWVVGAAAAATALYIVSLQVATERSRLETVDRKIAAARRDIRQLQTELGTRASLRQLERWNGEVLALSAPDSSQFLDGEAALANLDGTKLPQSSFVTPAVMIAAANVPAAPVAETVGQTTLPAKQSGAIKPLVMRDPKSANPRQTAKPQQVAMLDRTLVDHRTLGEIMREAASEARAKGRVDQ
jgi:hypothetical protein